MARQDVEGTVGRLRRSRPGDELRAAQHTLENQIRDLIVAFGARTGVCVTNVQVEYLQPPSRDGHGPADIIVRTALET